jgi:hypothetical protein
MGGCSLARARGAAAEQPAAELARGRGGSAGTVDFAGELVYQIVSR